MILGFVFEASPHGRDGFGREVLGQHHQHNWGLRFSFFGHLNISRVLEASYVWCQEGNWGPKQAP